MALLRKQLHALILNVHAFSTSVPLLILWMKLIVYFRSITRATVQDLDRQTVVPPHDKIRVYLCWKDIVPQNHPGPELRASRLWCTLLPEISCPRRLHPGSLGGIQDIA